MQAFRFGVYTTLYFGSDSLKKNSHVFSRYGKRAFIITSKFPEGTHFSLYDTEAVLKDLGIEYKINDEVRENPPVESVVAIGKIVMDFKPDFLIALGGGSAIDTAKAISALMKVPGKDPMTVLFGDGGLGGASVYADSLPGGGLPLIVVPTTAGTGSEVTSAAVLTRTDRDTKDSMLPKVWPDAAFLDAKYIKSAPPKLIHSGAIDALAHGIETYVNVKSNYLNRSIAEIGFRLFSEFKDRMLANTMTDDDYEKMTLASTIQGMAFMQAGTCLPHGMGYALSHHKHVPHGLACGILLGEYLRAFKDQSLVTPVVRMCGFESVDAFAKYIQDILVQDIRIEVSKEEVEGWAKEFSGTEHRLARHPEPIAYDGVLGIYERALRSFMAS